MSMALALGIVEQNGKHYVILEATQDNVQVKLSVTDEVNYEEDLDVLITGLTEIKKQMGTAKSGLFVPEGVTLNGARSIQGRPPNRTRGKGQQGPRSKTG